MGDNKSVRSRPLPSVHFQTPPRGDGGGRAPDAASQQPPDGGDHARERSAAARFSTDGVWSETGSKAGAPDGGGDLEPGSELLQHQLHGKAPLHRTPEEEKSGFRRVVLAIFATRELAGKKNRELYISYIIRELAIYAMYLVVLCLLTFGMTNATTYYFSRVIYDLFIDNPFETTNTFSTSSDIIDFWDFQDEILENLYWYESSGVRRYVLEAKDSQGQFYQNQLIGLPRFRQLRVKGDLCPANDTQYTFVMKECFLGYSVETEEVGIWPNEFGALPEPIKDAWTYRTASQLNDSTSHWGRLSHYSGAGAIQDLGRSYNTTQLIMAELKSHIWITTGTRAVFLDFTVYNSNINLFCVVRLVWEFSPTGALTTSWSLRTVRLIRYLTHFDKNIVFPCEILFCLFTAYYLLQELVELCCLGCGAYFCDMWTYLDLALLAISGVCIGFSAFRYNLVEERLTKLDLTIDMFHDFEYVAYWQTQFNHAVSVTVFLAWIKIFKYISFNKTMTQLSQTLSRCAKDIGGFAIMFFIVFFAFAQLGYLIFGSQVEDFSTFEDAIFTLLRLILGDFNYRQLEDANRILGPIFFMVYVFFVFFVLLNMFLAIINDTYGEVKAEIQSQRNEFEIADYFKRLFFGRKQSKAYAETLVKISDGDEDQITYDELRKDLINAHFSEVEVEMFLARYELDQDRALDEEETQQVLADLEGKKIILDKFAEKANIGASPLHDDDAIAVQEALYAEEFTDLQGRVTLMENCVFNLQRKVDQLLVDLEE